MGIFFFSTGLLIGYLIRYTIEKTTVKQNNIFKTRVFEDGNNWSEECPKEFNAYKINRYVKFALNYSDSCFYTVVKDTFCYDGIHGYNTARLKLNLIKKKGEYYELFAYKTPLNPMENLKYKFDMFFILTPDTIYKLKAEPIIYRFDTIRPIKKKH